MLWAIDIGNTQTVVGVHQNGTWQPVWRIQTNARCTEDELAATLLTLADHAGIELRARGVAIASVVPPVDESWTLFCQNYFGFRPFFLRNGDQVGLPVIYDPPHAVGADRIANALAALALKSAPVVVVDFGTATTFDCVNRDGAYQGGAIMPGLLVSLASLVEKTAKLPAIAIEAPERAVGRHTVESLQSGVVLGYADAVDGLARRIRAELGDETSFLCTGGLGSKLSKLCREIGEYDPNLTLEGLRIAWERAH